MGKKQLQESAEVYKVPLSRLDQPLCFPKRCVCCGGPAETQLLVYYERSTGGIPITTYHERGYNVPYCKKCARYGLWSHQSGSYGIGAWFSFTFAWLVLATAERTEGKVFGFLLLLLGIFLTYRALWHIVMRRSHQVKDCCVTGTPVKFVWEGSPYSPHKSYFVFHNRNYALDFAQMNGLTVERQSDSI